MAEKPETDAGGSRRKRRDSASGASSVTAERENAAPGEQFLSKRLRLRVNRAKSAVDRPWKPEVSGLLDDRRAGHHG